MADRITINFTAETRDVERGADRMADSLKDTEGALDDLGNKGVSATEEVTDGLSDVGDAADDTGGRLGDLGSIGRDVLEGDLSGAAEGAAEALSLIGPAGALAGAVAVAGIGLVSAEIQNQAESTERLKSQLASLYTDAIAEGRVYIDATRVIADAQDVMTNPARLAEYNAAQTDAKNLAIDVSTVVLANAGDQESLNIVLEAAAQKQDTYAAALAGAADAGERNNITKGRESEVINDLISRYDNVASAQATARENAQNAADLGVAQSQRERDQIVRTSAADQARWDAQAANYAAAAGQAPIVIPVTIDDSEAQRKLSVLRQRQADIVIGVRYANGKEALR